MDKVQSILDLFAHGVCEGVPRAFERQRLRTNTVELGSVWILEKAANFSLNGTNKTATSAITAPCFSEMTRLEMLLKRTFGLVLWLNIHR